MRFTTNDITQKQTYKNENRDKKMNNKNLMKI